jgi:ABC-type molybdate transport system substrate-binding protein
MKAPAVLAIASLSMFGSQRAGSSPTVRVYAAGSLFAALNAVSGRASMNLHVGESR